VLDYINTNVAKSNGATNNTQHQGNLLINDQSPNNEEQSLFGSLQVSSSTTQDSAPPTSDGPSVSNNMSSIYVLQGFSFISSSSGTSQGVSSPSVANASPSPSLIPLVSGTATSPSPSPSPQSLLNELSFGASGGTSGAGALGGLGGIGGGLGVGGIGVMNVHTPLYYGAPLTGVQYTLTPGTPGVIALGMGGAPIIVPPTVLSGGPSSNSGGFSFVDDAHQSSSTSSDSDPFAKIQ
jgi:hypothetical protein